MFLAEVKQAGAFLMQGLAEPDFRRAVGVVCPERAVSLRARRGVAPGESGRLPAAAVAPGQLRDVVRLGQRDADGRHQELTVSARSALTDRGAGRRLLGHGAGDPVRARGPRRAAVGTRGGALRRRCSARAPISATCRTPNSPTTCRWPATCRRALADAEDVLIAVPSHAFREVLTAIRALLTAGQRLCWATKGFEISSGRLPGPGGPRGAGHRAADRGALRAHLCARSGRRPADGHDHRLARCRLRRAARARFLHARLPRLHLHRHHRRRGRRCGQERARHRCRALRRPGVRRQLAHRADHPRAGRDDAPGRRARARSARPSWDWPGSATWC